MKSIQTDRKKRLWEFREMLSDKELFLSQPYRETLQKYAAALGKKKDICLMVDYDEDLKSKIAFTNGDMIYLNAANQLTDSIPNRNGKIRSHEGLIAHECGHLRYSDFTRHQAYVNGFTQGLVFPDPPEPRTIIEKRNWEEFRFALINKDQLALKIIAKVAADLNNILEDVYIEAKMCEEYPGSVNAAIQMNAPILISSIPDANKRRQDEASSLTIMMDLIFRYARTGKTDAEAGYSKQYIQNLDQCRRIIDQAVVNPNPDSRFHATNQILLKLWRHIRKTIEQARKEVENLPEKDRGRYLNDFLKENCNWLVLSQNPTGKNNVAQYTIPGWRGDPQGNTENESGVETVSTDQSVGNCKTSRIKTLTLYRNGQIGNTNDQWSILGKAKEIVNDLAEKKLTGKEEQELKEKRQRETENQKFNGIHNNIHVKYHRTTQFREDTNKEYETLLPEIRKVVKHLERVIEDILIRSEEKIQSGLYMGKRLNQNNLYRQDGKIFARRILPDTGLSLAVAVLVDNSDSMRLDDRIGYARLAALTLYSFCHDLAIPIMVYGHSTHQTNEEETVDIFSYADFDSSDGKDPVRIMEMDTYNANRDGVALKIVGDCLMKREEEIRMLILISDGKPNGIGYYGDIAKNDLQDCKLQLEKQGVKLFAAAIGDDKQSIEDIYREGFLNISDLKQMPVKLGGLLAQYIR